MQETMLSQYETVTENDVKTWFKVGNVNDFPDNGGACIKYKDKQIAVYNFTRKNKWYACQNLCPHKMEMVLSRGMVGDLEGIPKVACPMHKKTFSLEDGKNLNGDDYQIAVYPVKIEDENVYIGFVD
jgi:nitrite reductase (NADH) small subunit